MTVYLLIIQLFFFNSSTLNLNYTPFGINVVDGNIFIPCKSDKYYIVKIDDKKNTLEEREVERQEFLKNINDAYEFKLTDIERISDIKIISGLFAVQQGGVSNYKNKCIQGVRISFYSYDDGHSVINTFAVIKNSNSVYIVKCDDIYVDIVEANNTIILVKKNNSGGSVTIINKQ